MLSKTGLNGRARLTVENMAAMAVAALAIVICISNQWFDAICMFMRHDNEMDELVGSSFILLATFVLLFVRRDNQLRGRMRSLQRQSVENRKAARRDFLTGIGNRLALTERLDAARGQPVTFISFDLDGFKAINDQFGHAAGDAVLIEVARRLARIADMLPGTSAVRLGGDEFGCLVTATAPSATETLLAMLSSSFNEPVRHGALVLNISASIGIAACLDGNCSMDDLLHNADLAMYNVKRQRRAGTARWVGA